MTPDQILALKTGGAPHQVLVKDLPYTDGAEVRRLDIWGFTAMPFWKRIYPEGTLAAHLLGFVNTDREGVYGLEGWYNGILTPTQMITHSDTMLAGADLVSACSMTASQTPKDLCRARGPGKSTPCPRGR